MGRVVDTVHQMFCCEGCRCDLSKSPLPEGSRVSHPSQLKVAEIVLWRELLTSLQLQLQTKQKAIFSFHFTRTIANATHAQKSAVNAYTIERRIKNLKPK